MDWKKAALIHIPHSSIMIPEAYMKSFKLSEDELRQELLKMTDHFVDDLFETPEIITHKNQISRLVMDPERFRDDKDEPMAKYGMGYAYTHSSNGMPLRSLSEAEKTRILHELYDPYHEHLSNKVQAKLSEHNICLIIDAHSFPAKPLPYEHTHLQRPDICLGYECYHMNMDLLMKAESYFKEKCGLSVSHNEPFSGSIVPFQYYHRDPRVISLMVEINRSMYMNEETGIRNDRYIQMKKWIAGFLSHVM